jgi:hypothetical protein
MVDAMKAPIEFLDLSLRAVNVLRRMKISQVGQLLEYSASDMLKWKNCGSRTVAEIQAELLRLGFNLAGSNVSPMHHEKTKVLQQIRELKECIAGLREKIKEIESAEVKEKLLQRQNDVPDAFALDVARMRAEGNSYGKIAARFNVSGEWARVKHLQTIDYIKAARSAMNKSYEEIAASIGFPMSVLESLIEEGGMDGASSEPRRSRSSRHASGRSSGHKERDRQETERENAA